MKADWRGSGACRCAKPSAPPTAVNNAPLTATNSNFYAGNITPKLTRVSN
jgi:hypothetical protein